MELHLPDLPMMRILSYLDAFSLLQVSQVSKTWNKTAGSDLLWKKLCLKKWCFCKFIPRLENYQSWKEFFISQTKQEYLMARAKPEDFIYKEISGHIGIVFQVSYLSGNGITLTEPRKSVICITSSWCTISTWDVHKGTMIWSSPVQQKSLTLMATLPQMHLAITEDLNATLKVWNCRDENALATRAMPCHSRSMAPFLTKDGPFLAIGDCDGNVHTFTMPNLELLSTVNAFTYDVNHLHCSPDKKWIVAYGTHPRVLPKVFFLDSLLKPSEHSSPLHFSFPFASCYRACWIPRRENRIILMYRIGSNKVRGFITYDLMTTEMPGGQMDVKGQRVANFLLPPGIKCPHWMDVSPENVILFESGKKLLLYSITGKLLHQTADHQADVLRLQMDYPHVTVILEDGSLHLYMWDEERCHPYLRSCCHLEYKGENLTKLW
uniref:F-box/WD repeat-containing protein 12 n=1 Tax=Jaculus jaculus TaxID=51337 RepID=UPI001E1AF57B|nr:F-box/WD repeat-containing protein 12 [Jaculus jaculus]